MKKIVLSLILAIAGVLNSGAQYTSIVNQAASLLQSAIIGGSNYKGFVDVSYVAGIGNLQADFIGVSTVQGWQLKNWVFIGAGLGVDYVYSETETGYSTGDQHTRTSGVMIPIFTDFRFNIGSRKSPSFFIDIKAGGSFLIGKDYLAIENGYIDGSEYFMLKPSLGLRVPLGSNGKKAMNFGITYQLLTCNYWWYNNSSSGTLNSLGGTVSYEW